ncbi:MAG: rhodanese-like domain-containing protein, partial [Gammaproteobacteria bacterium]|nr:rhodanese-like domain-containing protein [Gammaproteobacteria bacterium]
FAVDEAIAAGNAGSVFDFSKAKTLVLFCNGMWCGQSPASMKSLLKYGYPAEKIKWYRDGMQAWEILGFNTVKP